MDSRVDSWGRADPARRALIRRLYDGIPPPKRPAWVATQAGGLRVHDGTPTQASRQVSVFDPAGRWAGRVSLPNGLLPWQIGADYAVAAVDRSGRGRTSLPGVLRVTADSASFGYRTRSPGTESGGQNPFIGRMPMRMVTFPTRRAPAPWPDRG